MSSTGQYVVPFDRTEPHPGFVSICSCSCSCSWCSCSLSLDAGDNDDRCDDDDGLDVSPVNGNGAVRDWIGGGRINGACIISGLKWDVLLNNGGRNVCPGGGGGSDVDPTGGVLAVRPRPRLERAVARPPRPVSEPLSILQIQRVDIKKMNLKVV